MSNTPEKSSGIRPVLKRNHVEAMLAHLSEQIGASLQLDDNSSVAFSYYEDGEATLLFLEPLGLLVLSAPVADPDHIEMPRLRELLETNMDWKRPCAIIVPDNDTRAHLTTILPVDPNDPSSLERWIVKAVVLAGETSCAANVIDILAPGEPTARQLA